ncbi:MAG: beta-galactosidase [Candidatus Lokiarchaeota archaeon]|nr:beta-galactosidase [Candidatus Lokiarchaeota archaeon]
MTSNAWNPVKGDLITNWAAQIDPRLPLPEYPRPQFKRRLWKNLNGLWEYAIRLKSKKWDKKTDGEILVPFPIESSLSGVKKSIKPKDKLWYRRYFTIPEEWKLKTIFLHFGAVDWHSIVWINGNKVGEHKGGYTPFKLDITDSLKDNKNELVIEVWDPTNKGRQERGKQVLRPSGVFYTAISGIWQTVWLEPVNSAHIADVKIKTNIDTKLVSFTIKVVNPKEQDEIKVEIEPNIKKTLKMTKNTNNIKLKIADPILWAPNKPYLYNTTIELERNGEIIDKVDTYFGMRKIHLMKDEEGVQRIALNNQILFQYGPLDQGYWPDGLYTAPTDDALKYDIEIAKKLGFNMIRKHIKVEPARWYHYCDKLGMLVWQDMPNGGRVVPGEVAGLVLRELLYIPIGRLRKKNQANYYVELKNMIECLYNHPSIVMWVPFNEGWGQFKTEKVVELIRKLDDTRLINNASGWMDREVGDVHDIHSYPGPKMPDIEEERAAVNGEFGGLGLEIKGHSWDIRRKWGYRKMSSNETFTERYKTLMKKLKSLIKKGLSAAVYTQITDVEGEINGLLTYDREIIKIEKNILIKIHKELLDWRI